MGVRLALACQAEGCMWREFADPDARCPAHPQRTYAQANRPYMGAKLAQPQVGLPVLDPTNLKPVGPQPRKGKK